MKKIYGFAFAAAILSLASCSNENEPTPAPLPEVEDAAGYLAINIVNPAGTRADQDATTGSFVDGSPAENAATNATFLFFQVDSNGEGTQTQVPQTAPLGTLNDPANNDPNKDHVAKVTNAIVVVGGRDNTGETAHKPTHVLVLLNDPNTPAYYTGKKLSEVYSEVTSAENKKTTGFVMTNAAYFSKDAANKDFILCATPVDAKIKTSRKDAADDPLDIFVERVTAKVTTYCDATNITYKGYDQAILVNDFNQEADGSGSGSQASITIKPKIESVSIANMAPASYLFKKLEESWAGEYPTSSWTVNDEAHHRSNWAVSPTTTLDKYINVSYTAHAGEKATTFYVPENTEFGKDVENAKPAHTCLLLTATLQKTDGTNSTAVDLVRWAGIYYTADGYKKQALNQLTNYFKKTADNKYENLSLADVEYLSEADHKEKWDATFAKMVAGTKIEDTDLMQYEQALQIKKVEVEEGDKKVMKDVVTLYKVKDASAKKNVSDLTDEDFDTTSDSNAEVNTKLISKENRVWYWQGGKTYFYVDIKHDGPADGTTENGVFTPADPSTYDFSTGIVRNNDYTITVNSIAGLGTPVYYPGEVIIPQTPSEDLWYVGAKINILKWRVVANSADINQVPL